MRVNVRTKEQKNKKQQKIKNSNKKQETKNKKQETRNKKTTTRKSLDLLHRDRSSRGVARGHQKQCCLFGIVEIVLCFFPMNFRTRERFLTPRVLAAV